MFNPTIIIYIYAYIIISLIVFDICYTLNENLQEKINQRKFQKYKKMIQSQIDNLVITNTVTKKDINRLYWKLRRVNNLLMFQKVIEHFENNDIPINDTPMIDTYIIKYISTFQLLADYYKKQDSIYQAYFAMFLVKHYPFRLGSSSIIDETMMEYVTFNSIYSRENAMLYFYERGSSSLVVTALKKIDTFNLYYNKKLLSNDLLKFKGDKLTLANQLYKEFNNFSIDFQVSIINYLKFSNINFNAPLLRMLNSKEYDKEVNLAIIRYFGKTAYPKALSHILKLLENDELDIEYKIIICQILYVYDCRKARFSLISCINNPNWYVRKNAATSLAKMNLTQTEKNKLKNIDDNYGKQMIEYTFKTKIKKPKEEKKEVVA